MLSKNEEDYIKALFSLLSQNTESKIGTNDLAEAMNVSPASANSMLKKLRTKDFVDFKRYGKISLTENGKSTALMLVRKHRLWETFLYQKLDFSWDEVHDVAEQLEHVTSKKMIDKLDEFLGFPELDPHGDPIPRSDGSLIAIEKQTLAKAEVNGNFKIVAVRDVSTDFLQYLTEIGLELGSEIEVLEKRNFDNSLLIKLDGKELSVSEKFSLNVFVRKN